MVLTVDAEVVSLGGVLSLDMLANFRDKLQHRSLFFPCQGEIVGLVSPTPWL
jgi:hypothetical protein